MLDRASRFPLSFWNGYKPFCHTTSVSYGCVCDWALGDWVRMGDREHGAKGLCQERAFVSGLEAANALSRSGALSSSRSSGSVDKDQRKERQANVIPIRDDEIQFTAARNLNKNFIGLLGENNPFDYVLGLRK